MNQTNFLKWANNRWAMRYFLWSKLPAAWFMGIRVKSCTSQLCEVLLPYGWPSRNPFRSTYFAAQCAAGELSTGLLMTAALAGQPPVSMLVTKVESAFTKKANQMLTFRCEEGAAAQEAVAQAIATGQPVVIRMTSIGTLPDGTEASRVWLTWSLKLKG
jgi:Domain of unknown function (DUF4442)